MTTSSMYSPPLERPHSRRGARSQESGRRQEHRLTIPGQPKHKRLHSDPIIKLTKSSSVGRDATSPARTRRQQRKSSKIVQGDSGTRRNAKSSVAISFDGDGGSNADMASNVEADLHFEKHTNRDARNESDEKNSMALFEAGQQPHRQEPASLDLPRPQLMLSPFPMPNPAPPSPPHSRTFPAVPSLPRVISESPPPRDLGSGIALSPKMELEKVKVEHLRTLNESSSRNDEINHREFTAEWVYINKRRIDISSLRTRTQEMRATLRETQEKKSTAEDKMIQRVRARELGVRISNTSFETITELLDDVQRTRDVFGPLEFECQQLEDHLYQDEFELHKQEASFFSKWNMVSSYRNPIMEEGERELANSTALTGEDADENNDFHPLVVEYLSTQGDLDILHERLVDLEYEYHDIEQRRESRVYVGKNLASEEQTIWNNYPNVRRHLTHEIDEVKAKVADLRVRCFQMQLVDEEGDPIDWENGNGHEWKKLQVEDKDKDDTSFTVSGYAKYSTLLPETSYKPYSLNVKDIEFTTPIFVNSWMLDSLQNSAIEVDHLAAISEGTAGKFGKQWEVAVVEFWFKDDTMKTTQAVVYTSSSFT